MVLARRVAKLEDGSDPQAAVLRWLTEAHAYGTLEAYTDSWTSLPVSERPLARITQQIEDATQQRLRGQRIDLKRATDRAVHAAVLRVQLVVQLNIEADDSFRVDGMICVAHHYRMRELAFRGLLSEQQPAEAQGETLGAHSAAWIEQVVSLHGRLGAKRAARERLEERFFAGTDSLFPETSTRIGGLEGMAADHLAIATADDPEVAREPEESTIEARADTILALATRVADVFMGWIR